MIFAAGSTSISIDIQIVDDSGLAVTGLVAATFPTLTYSLGGANADVAFPSLSDLVALTTAYSSGGVKERGGGVYRLDLPNGVFTTAGVVKVRGEASGKHVLVPWIDVGPKVDVDTIKTNPVVNAGTLTFPTGATLASTTNITAGTITTVTTVTNQLTTAQIATGLWQDATSGDFTVANSIGKSLYTSGVVPGGSGGLLISGSNSGTTTLGALTVTGATTLAALSGTTLTFSGAVAFQSTFAVTTSTSLAALSCTTLTASGAVAFQSTFATTGTTTFNAFTITNAFTVSGATTHTGAFSATNAGNDIRGITAGTITTVTNLTNAPTSGDFTATMKTSIGTAVAASAVASVTGNVGGIAGTTQSLDALQTALSSAHGAGSWATATGFSTLVATDIVSAGAIATSGGAVVTAITTGTVATVGDKTGYTLTSGERDSIAAALLDLANGIESGKTLRQALRLIAASLAGKRSGAGTATEQYDAIGSPGTGRIIGNLDSDGNGIPTLTP